MSFSDSEIEKIGFRTVNRRFVISVTINYIVKWIKLKKIYNNLGAEREKNLKRKID